MHSPESWAGALTLYHHAMLAANRSAGTIRLHWHYLAQLRDRHARPWTVSTGDLQRVMSNSRWGAETRKSARTVYRGFYGWGHGRGFIGQDPALGLATVRVPAGRPRPAPEHVVRQLLRDRDARIGLMAMLAAFGGLRCAEIAQVHAEDWPGSRYGSTLIVHGKGGKVRGVPIVDERLATRLDLLESWAFPNGYGTHLSAGHVSKLLSAALPHAWTAHTLRHRCATVAYAGTRDLLAVGALLGHSRPETTQRYVLMPEDAIRAAARAAARVA